MAQRFFINKNNYKTFRQNWTYWKITINEWKWIPGEWRDQVIRYFRPKSKILRDQKLLDLQLELNSLCTETNNYMIVLNSDQKKKFKQIKKRAILIFGNRKIEQLESKIHYEQN